VPITSGPLQVEGTGESYGPSTNVTQILQISLLCVAPANIIVGFFYPPYPSYFVVFSSLQVVGWTLGLSSAHYVCLTSR
jgi:hypothetical protein